MKKRYIFGTLFAIIIVVFFASIIVGLDKKDEEYEKTMMPRVGQRLWTYNMNKHTWREYNKRLDEDDSKEEIILQVQMPEGNGAYTSYALLTGNAQVPKEAFWVGEGSEEFLVGKNLYSYYPKQFEYYQILFNGVKFVPRKISEKEVKEIFSDYKILKVSDLKKHKIELDISKGKKYLILNDGDENFYKYYIVPNDSSKLKLGEYSNQFEIKGQTDIKIQRLEGCSSFYPCYEIKVR